MTWLAKKIFPKKKEELELTELLKQLSAIKNEEARALASHNIVRQRKPDKDPSEKNVNICVADGNGGGIANKLLDGTIIGHGLGFFLRTFGKLTDLASSHTVTISPRKILQLGAETKLEEIRKKKVAIENKIFLLENKIREKKGLPPKENPADTINAQAKPKIPHR